jgi:hypothetical protein
MAFIGAGDFSAVACARAVNAGSEKHSAAISQGWAEFIEFILGCSWRQIATAVCPRLTHDADHGRSIARWAIRKSAFVAVGSQMPMSERSGYHPLDEDERLLVRRPKNVATLKHSYRAKIQVQPMSQRLSTIKRIKRNPPLGTRFWRCQVERNQQCRQPFG